ncbi:flagellin [Nitrosomonas eutropha]|uniref:Flagellin n=1 Tax=Nitrosomonas eutropha TaxID=916 RepID=A0A1I7EU16_9PROT|nr:flagellin [Nitrosomonas eutropha]SFU27389.1 flagellin [Nitrosomonas eutropha]
MPQVINTNIASLNSQRNLNSSQNALNTALNRLSSGLRINSAKDDAAGLAISERMTSQIRGLNQAARNANDGISLAQTAEGALSEIGNNLQRIRELAVQSRNATNSNDDRAALQKEAAQLKAEINRVASQTSFNGTKLLDGSFSNKVFQVGANVGETISIASITNATSANLGTSSVAQVTGVAATAFTAITAGDLTINGVSVGAIAADTNAANRASNIMNAINSYSSQTGVYATILSSAPEQLVLTNSGSVTATPNIVIAGAATAATTGLTAGTTAPTTSTGFAALDVSSEAGADTAITTMDAALKAVNSARADLGAIQNRFGSVVTNLQTASENLSASRSRIQDTDFAAETAALTRAQIMQQAGVAMLAQANALPNNVLSLLR